jgi:DNA replication protein DnaC
MQNLSSNIVARLQSYTLRLPDEAQCEVCHGFDLDHEGVRDALVERGYAESGGGRLMSMAACQCPEIEHQQREELVHRRRDSGLPHTNNTFATSKKRKGSEDAFDAAADIVNRGSEPILVLQGEVGVGKTTLLECIGHAALERGQTVRYLYMPEALEQLRGTFGDTAEQQLYDLIEEWQNASLLLLDDLGIGKTTDWSVAQIGILVDERYRNNRRLVVATNLNKDGIERTCGLRVADRLFDRGTGKAKRVGLTGKSYRQEVSR